MPLNRSRRSAAAAAPESTAFDRTAMAWDRQDREVADYLGVPVGKWRAALGMWSTSSGDHMGGPRVHAVHMLVLAAREAGTGDWDQLAQLATEYGHGRNLSRAGLDRLRNTTIGDLFGG